MEEITSLINQAKNNVNELETYVFQNCKQSYCNLKAVTTNMMTKMDTIESFIEATIDDQDYLEKAKADLDYIISTCIKLKDLYITKIVSLVLCEDGKVAIITNDIKETTNNQEETVNLMNALDDNRVETVMPTANMETDSIMQTLEDYENPQVAIEPTTITPNNTEVPQNEYEKDLDVDAINAFLNGETPVGIRL